ncbi:MAG: L-serine ammonia-lyase, iron-sulfur-dependent, subunit alpha [Clostridiales bacterium]|nr:L-serine ammonia-lyase, iron-sulfur-dependent, subunit alpha [Clostridiales bacterium]
MDISMFEVVGPTMLGPSSSATAGMARLGLSSHEFCDEPVKSIDLKFTPQFQRTYAGDRSHFALIGGIMGYNVSDEELKNALEIAKSKGITITTSVFEPSKTRHTLTVRMTLGLESGKKRVITGISVGGGSIEINEVDGFPVTMSSVDNYVFIWADQNISKSVEEIFAGLSFHTEQKDGKYLIYGSIGGKDVSDEIEQINCLSGVTLAKKINAVVKLGFVPHKPLFTTYKDLIQMTKDTGKSIAELAIEYEVIRSGRLKDDIIAEMLEEYKAMKYSCDRGLNSEVIPLYGYNDGKNGKRLLHAAQEGKTYMGPVMGKAIARGIATIEYGMSMGKIVAAPTCGSCGILPACMVTAQEEKGLSDRQMVDALFVAATMGVVMYYDNASFSGSKGGCQAEISVSSSMAAAALAYLSGADAEGCIHACALAIKALLGLVCDPVGGATEVPCIKRNGSGVAVAFTCADMALAGIRSYIPPDEVIDALVNVQQLLPPELRACGGGCQSTKTDKITLERTHKHDEAITLPLSDL